MEAANLVHTSADHVDVSHCRRNALMACHILNDLEVNPGVNPQRNGCVAKIMEPDATTSPSFHKPLKSMSKASMTSWQPTLATENGLARLNLSLLYDLQQFSSNNGMKNGVAIWKSILSLSVTLPFGKVKPLLYLPPLPFDVETFV